MKRNFSRVSVMVLFVLAVAASAMAAGRQFVSAPQYATDGGSDVIVQGDLNHDGIQDLVVGSVRSAITVMLGRKDGTFGPIKTFTVPFPPLALALGDLTGDGNLDLAAALSGETGSEVEVFRGMGNGIFKPGVVLTGIEFPAGIAIADLNKDQKNDLLVLSGDSNPGYGVEVYLNAGHGSLGSPTLYNVFEPPTGLTVADFNNDGNVDVAVATAAGGAVSVFLGKGNGTLSPFVNYAAGDNPISIASGDMNHDGKIDLVVGTTDDSGTEGLAVLLNNGSGTFGQPIFTAMPASKSLQLGDFNGDGKLDAAALGARSFESQLMIAVGTGNGAFAPSPTAYGLPGSNIALGDFNRDKRIDVAVAEGSVGILFGRGNGTFYADASYVTGLLPSLLAVDDFNNDGKQDLVVPASNFAGNAIFTLPGKGNGTFQPAKITELDTGVGCVAVADFNVDSNKDLVFCGNNQILVFSGNGDGTFTQTATYPFSHAASSIVAADFNGDKMPDIAVAGDIGVFVFLNNGDGTFGPPTRFAPGYNPGYITAADLNKDGTPDLVIGGGYVLLGNGDGTFQNPIQLPGNTGLGFATPGDFNHDGKPDLAGLGVANGVSQVTIYLGNGDGTFDLGSSYAVPGAANMTTADFNADGSLDLAVTTGTAVELLVGTGNGNFVDAGPYGSGSAFLPIAAADFNGDHRPDLAVTDSRGDVVTVLMNTGKK